MYATNNIMADLDQILLSNGVAMFTIEQVNYYISDLLPILEFISLGGCMTDRELAEATKSSIAQTKRSVDILIEMEVLIIKQEYGNGIRYMVYDTEKLLDEA